MGCQVGLMKFLEGLYHPKTECTPMRYGVRMGANEGKKKKVRKE